jgi:hypothetical protein
MALGPEDLAQIDGLLGSADAETSAVQALREQFPELSLTRCDQSDVDADEPFREYATFSIYLVDGADHCWRLTTDPAHATGLVVAKKRVSS